MNKLFTKVVGVTLGAVMALGIGFALNVSTKDATAAYAAGTTVSWTAAKASDLGSSGTTGTITLSGGSNSYSMSYTRTTKSGSGYTGTGLMGGAIQIGKSSSVENITFTTKNVPGTIKSVSVYCASYNSGHKVGITVGDSTYLSSTSTPKWSNNSTGVKTGTGESSGEVVIAFTSGTRALYIKSISITFEEGSQKEVTALNVYDENSNLLADGDKINLSTNLSSVSTNILCQVSYNDLTSDSDVKITSNPSAGFSYSSGEGNDYTLTFGNNGDYIVTITSTKSESHSLSVTFSVSGIPTTEYELYTNAITEGDYVIMSNDDSFTYTLGTTIYNNRVANGGAAPAVSNDTIVNPNAATIWEIARNGNYWTIKNKSTGNYLAGTTAKNQATLKATLVDDDKYSLWTITYDGGWSFVNLGRTSGTSDTGNAYLRNNTTNGWACYASSTGNAPALFKLRSFEPAINVGITGNTSLEIGEQTTLTVEKINGAKGTVNWTTTSNAVSLSGNTGDSIVVTGLKGGEATVTASLEGCTSVETLFTVNKALTGIAVTTPPNKTTYTEGESFDKEGMVITATYNDGTTENPTDYTYSPDGALTINHNEITISWNGKTTTQAIKVNAKVVKNLSVSTLPTKNTYHSGEEFDSAGLIILVTYEDDSTATLTSGFTISPDVYTFTSSDVETGSKTFTVSYGGKTTTFEVQVTPLVGAFETGWYYITASSSDGATTHYFPKGKYNAASASNNPKVTEYNSSVYGQAYYFELVADNTYTISYTDGENTYYLNAINDNSGAKVSTVASVGATCLWTHSIDDDGNNHLSSTDGTNTRYLAVYNDQDWRTYKNLNTQNSVDSLTIIHENDKFANDFVNTYTSGCNASGSYTSLDWVTAKAHFESLNDSSEFANATYTSTGTGNQTVITPSDGVKETVANAVAKYDYIVTKYNTNSSVVFEEFMHRVDAAKISYTNKINLFGISKNNNDTLLIIVLVSLTGFAALGGYMFLKRRKEQ